MLLAQLALVASVSVGDASGLGYVSPSYGVGLAVEQQTERFEFTLGGDWSPEKKFATRVLVPPFAPQFTAGASAQGLAKLGIFRLGPGLDYSYTKSDGWDKTAWRWHVAGGVDVPVEDNRLRFLVSHYEPIADESNDLKGERYSLRLDVPSGKVTFRPGFELGAWRFHQSGNPDVRYSRRTWAVSLGIAR